MTKFMIWDEHAKEMHSWEHVGDMDTYGYLNLWSALEGGIDHYKVRQYIGIKDSDGVEIYNGDIVECDSEGDKEIHYVEYKSEDEYPAFDLVPNVSCESNGLSYYKAVGCIKVIGNIYQDSGLLNND